jgi:hypothetical protein
MVYGLNRQGRRHGQETERDVPEQVPSRTASPGRRRVLALALGYAGSAFTSALAQTASAPKISQNDAQYQQTPKDIRSCGSCSLFQPPNACKAVAGIISPSGWCKLYVAVD